MKRSQILSAVATVGLIGILTTHAMAQLTEYTWNDPTHVGAQSWQVDGNWNLTGWPNDPGRAETDAATIVPSVGANLSVALTGNLTLDVGDTNVTVASLKLGGTLGAVTTNITSIGNDGKLVFENYEATNTATSPDTCSFNCGAALITSSGVAGSTNIISAPVHINGERLEFSAASTNNITISGPVSFANLTGTAPASVSASSIRNYMPSGTKLTISGSISLVDTVTGLGVPLTIFDNGAVQVPSAPPENANNLSTGTIEISGVIQDTAATGAPFGSLVIGPTSSVTVPAPIATLKLSGTNTFRGQTTLNRVNLILANNSALGVDTTLNNDRSGGASLIQGQVLVGNNILSDDDTRTISIDARFPQYQTVRGDHSLTWAGLVTESNNRGWANLLPTETNKTLTVTGPTYASSESAGNAEFRHRTFTYDGSGTTVVTGGWFNRLTGGVPDESTGSHGNFAKAGTGTLLVSDPGDVSTFQGDVLVYQGVVRFASDAIFDQARNVESFGGAIGVDTGTFTNATLLSKLRSMTPGLPDLNLYNGGLMLTNGEAAASIDFTTGDLALLSNMSVAPPQNGISYTGTITPAADAITTVPTYRLGGGNGVLTLPNNQLTGARNVQITNGGEVRLTGANTYTGVTRIQAKYHSTVQDQAIANTVSGVSGVQYEGTTLTVNTLLNGGVNSSIGSSTSDASNLVIQGSTLKYVGTGSNGTTNRLFTVGTGGATLEAASTDPASAMNFTNTGALVMGLAGPQDHAKFIDTNNVDDQLNSPGTVNTKTRISLNQVDDIIVGMNIIGPAPLADPGLGISSVNTPLPAFQRFAVTVAAQTAVNLPDFTATFSGVARTLTLTGSSTANNTLSPLIANATGTLGGSQVVNVAKSGTGKWILTGNNTYQGTTSVNAGTLLINGTQSGNGVATVAAGATLGGTGTYGGAITNNGTLSPGASVGTLTVTGNVTMGNNSHFAVELSGTSADKLAVSPTGTGNLDLAGPGPGDLFFNYLDVTGVGSGTSWVIATYTGTLAGIFESITPGYSVDYGTGANSQITLNLASLLGDHNNDTHVNAADYVTWRKDPAGHGNANGYFTWRENFGNPPADGPVLGGGAVPEPSGLVMIGMALAIGIGGVHRRG